MVDQTLSDPIFVLSFLGDLKTACDRYGIHKNIEMHLSPYVFRELAKQL